MKALLYYSVLTCSPSLIHLLLTHLMPSEVGHAPCRDIAAFTLNLTIRCKYNTFRLSSFPGSHLSRLYQNTADPALGLAATPMLGKAVKPPTRSER